MKLSIITINLNNKSGLEKTIKSVLDQTYQDFEYIVIDGLSNDGSKEVIKKYEHKIDHPIIEKDTGIYNAMNKGIKMAIGDYILFLNSGDLLCSNNILQEISKNKFDEDFIIFDLDILTREKSFKFMLNVEPKSILINGYIYHQSVFHKKKCFDKIGYYNENLKITSDYEFFLKAFFLYNSTYRILHQSISIYDDTEGVSCYDLNEGLINKERRIAQRNVFPIQFVEALEEKDKKIKELMGYKSLYIGLLNSKIVKIALFIIKSKNNLLKIINEK